jgi:hypothetical protein
MKLSKQLTENQFKYWNSRHPRQLSFLGNSFKVYFEIISKRWVLEEGLQDFYSNVEFYKYSLLMLFLRFLKAIQEK